MSDTPDYEITVREAAPQPVVSVRRTVPLADLTTGWAEPSSWRTELVQPPA
jgi:hypothetical protein